LIANIMNPAQQPDANAAKAAATACHEAGHAVMAWLVGRPVQKVTIAAGHLQFGGMRLGACELKRGKSRSSDDPLEDMALILLAGMVAESRFTGQDASAGAREDLRHVQSLIDSRASTEKQASKLFRRLLDKAEYLLYDDPAWLAVEAIAAELIERTTLSGRAVVHHCEQAARRCS
jgi:ATP-dependent Zn protease